jgi:hypothetical protein
VRGVFGWKHNEGRWVLRFACTLHIGECGGRAVDQARLGSGMTRGPFDRAFVHRGATLQLLMLVYSRGMHVKVKSLMV